MSDLKSTNKAQCNHHWYFNAEHDKRYCPNCEEVEDIDK